MPLLNFNSNERYFKSIYLKLVISSEIYFTLFTLKMGTYTSPKINIRGLKRSQET